MGFLACLCVTVGFSPLRSAPHDAGEKYFQLREQTLTLLDQKKYAEAADAARKLSDLDPRAAEAQLYLARALARLEKRTEALNCLSNAAEFGFDEPALLEKEEDLASLREENRYRQALARVKANDEAHVEKGRAIAGVRTVEGAPEGGLRYRLRMSPAATKAKPQRLLIWMHPSGVSVNQQIEPHSPRFNRRGFALLVFTKKDFRFWSSDDMPRLAKTLDAVSKVEGISDERPVLFGFSAGGQMALRLWNTDPAGMGGLVLMATFPEMRGILGAAASLMEPKTEAIKKVPMFVLVGLNDGISQSWKQQEQDIVKAGVPLVIRYIAGKGHTWLLEKNELAALDQWLAKRFAEARPAPRATPGWRPLKP